MDMKHRKTTVRRLLSVLLVLVMCMGMLPVTVLAADTKDTDEGEIRAGNVDAGAEPRFPIGIRRRAAAAHGMTSGSIDVTDGRVTGVEVAYPSVKRDTAEITYTVPGRSTGVHVIALLDISIDNRACLGMLSDVMYDCEKIRYEKAENGYTAHDTGTTAKTITYQHTAWDITGDNDASDSMVYQLNPDFKQPGLGQANEIAGLDMALSALNNVPDGQTPVLFWVLSPDAAIEAGQKDTTAIKAKLDEVRAKLSSMGGRLITWQMDSKASSWLAGDDTQVNHAATDTFRSKVQESLENIIADGVRDFEITLNVPGSVRLVTGFKTDGMAIRRVRDGIRHDGFEKFDTIINGRSATVKVPKLYNSIEDIEITFTVNLDTNLNIKDTVPGSALSSGGTYNLGIFDEVPVDYPVFDKEAGLDRTLRTVTFKAFDNAGPDKTKEFNGLPGEFILTPDASEWNATGQEFSGWVNVDKKDAYVRPGEEMKVPEEDVTMTALWGHVDLDLLLGDVMQGPEPGNMMYPGTDTSVKWYFKPSPYASTEFGFLVDLKNKFKNDLSVDWNKDIVSVTVVDEKAVSSGKPLDVVTVHGGINGGKPNGVYIGLDEKNPVAVYVLESKTDAGKYDLYFAGVNGVTAPYSLEGLFAGGSDFVNMS